MFARGCNKKYISFIKVFLFLFFWLFAAILFKLAAYSGGLISSVIGIIVFLFLDSKRRFLFILSGIPFSAVFKVEEGMPTTMVALYLIYIVCHLMNNKNTINKISFVLFNVLLFTQIMCVVFFDANIINIVSFLVSLVTMKCFIVDIEKIDWCEKQSFFKMSALIFALSMLCNIAITFIFPDLPYLIDYEKTSMLASQSRYAALNIDSNYYSQLVLVALGFLISIIKLYFNQKRWLKSFLLTLIFVFLAVNGLRANSKSYVLSIIILILFVLCMFLFSKKRSMRQVELGAVILVACLIFFVWFYSNVIIPVFEARENSLGILTGRDVIWKQYLSLFKDKLYIMFIGVGSGNGPEVYEQYYGIRDAAHNALIELFGDFGIIGISLILAFIIQGKNRKKISLRNDKLLFYIMFVITSLAISITTYDVVFIITPLLYCVLPSKKETSLNEGSNG